jgi:hypothetical protein
MTRASGYLANVLNIPPLIFRFQFHPEMLSEKKSFTYTEENTFGEWEFEKTRAAKGFGNVFSAMEDLKDIGSLLVGTKGLVAGTGKPRTFALDFALDARAMPDVEPPAPGVPPVPADVGAPADDARFGGRIEPSLAVLRSFMNPSVDPVTDVLGWISGTHKSITKSPLQPPLCMLKLGGLELDCVMTDLNIKITKFKPDLTPERVEISLTLSEQTRSLATSLDVIGRLIEVAKSYGQLNGDDWVQALPGAGLIQNVFEL